MVAKLEKQILNVGFNLHKCSILETNHIEVLIEHAPVHDK